MFILESFGKDEKALFYIADIPCSVKIASQCRPSGARVSRGLWMYLRVSAVRSFMTGVNVLMVVKWKVLFTIEDGGNLFAGLLIKREHCRRHGFGGPWCAERVSCFHRSRPRIFYHA